MYKVFFKLKIILVIGLFSSSLMAQMSSTNFSIQTSVVDEAGGAQSSAQYAMTNAVGQPTPPGEMSSANFSLWAGFLTKFEPEFVAGILVYLPDTTGNPGSTIQIPVMVGDVSGEDVLGVTMTVATDANVLKPIGASVAATLMQAWGAPTTNISDGQITIAGAGSTALADSGVLIYIQYLVNANAVEGQTTQLHFVEATFNEGEPAANPQDGLFRVVTGFDISGAVKYYANNQAIANAAMTLDGFSAPTNAQGLYSFAAIPSGNYALSPAKDGALGNSISAFDASFILRDVVGLIDLAPYQNIAADVSGNGGVSAFDASFILRYVVGLIAEFPVGENWTFVPANFMINESNWSSAPDSILYAPLNADQTGQDFKGIIYGDVSGNWSSPGAGLSKAIAGTATLTWGEIARLDEQLFSIPLQAEISGELLAAELGLSFDPNMISLQKITTSDDCVIEYRMNQGALTVALASAVPLEKNSNLLTLEFKNNQPRSNSETSLEISQAIFNEGQMEAQLENSQLTFNPAVPTKTELSQNYPNPFNPETTIQYQLQQDGKISLSIFDILGKQVRCLVDEPKKAGYYSAVWDAKNELGNAVASGIYFYRLETKGYAKTNKLLLIR